MSGYPRLDIPIEFAHAKRCFLAAQDAAPGKWLAASDCRNDSGAAGPLPFLTAFSGSSFAL